MEREYRLLEAAQFLSMDYKTLRRLLDVAKITPRRDDIDRRRQLLTQQQVDQIARLHRRGGERSIDALTERLAALEENCRILQQEYETLVQQLRASTAEGDGDRSGLESSHHLNG